MIKLIPITTQELIQWGWNINESDFKEYSYLEFNIKDKTVELKTTDDWILHSTDATNLSQLGYDCDYYQTLQELDNIGKLPPIDLTIQELKLQSIAH